MPTTTNMSLVLPTEDASADVWDVLLNAALTLVDSHDHSAGKGVKVPSAGLKINADVSWAFSGTNYAITDIKALDFVATAAAGITGYSSALFVNSSDDNLYFRNSGGTNVKVTDGNTLNVSIVGGIGGDYSSISALLDYDDATDTYRFRQETSASVRQYGKIAAADIVLREYLAAGDPTVPVNAVTIKSPAALAAAYTLTMPAAVPAAASLVRMTSAGVLDTSSSVDQDVSFATGRSITLVGTGKYKHGDQGFTVPFGNLFRSQTHSFTALVAGPPTAYAWTLGGGLTSVYALPMLPAGFRVKTLLLKGSSSNAHSGLVVTKQNYDTPTTLTFTTAGGFDTTGQVLITLDTPQTLIDGDIITFSFTAGADAIDLVHVVITGDRP